MYPFDSLKFIYRFELSHFELDDKYGKTQTYRFDFFKTRENPISWKEDVDRLPEHDIDFDKSDLTTIIEKKPGDVVQEDGSKKKVDCWYYPGYSFSVICLRDPAP